MTTENQLLREFVHAADTQDPLFDALGWIERARAALTHLPTLCENGRNFRRLWDSSVFPGC